MSVSAMVSRKPGGGPSARRPLVYEGLADQLLGKAAAEGWNCPGRSAIPGDQGRAGSRHAREAVRLGLRMVAASCRCSLCS
jgi:hypothetical protein